ncbi:MAG TPA: hypothetical protein DCW68_01060 [Rhodospirillaceae bacterium]|nr:MAG: hypothetical protein A2018_00555 [Alphaproteobacteria bacterium GWF2_58_20]HAU28688.1 hypothetical protein [Rhodospirillaceae bacterium]
MSRIAFFLVSLLVLASSTAQAADSAQREHVFRRRIEICIAWGGCDEDGAAVSVTGAPVISPIADQRIAKNDITDAISFTIFDMDTPVSELVVGISSADGVLLPAPGIYHSCNAGICEMILTPATDEIGQAPITVSVSDGTHTASSIFSLRVLDASAPFIGPIANQSGPVNQLMGPVAFLVDDLDTPLEDLVLDAFSSNEGILPVAGISFGGGGGSRTIALQPQTDALGGVDVSLVVRDPEGHVGERVFHVDFVPAAEPPAVMPPEIVCDDCDTKVVCDNNDDYEIEFTIDDADFDVDDLVVRVRPVDTQQKTFVGLVISCTGNNCIVSGSSTNYSGEELFQIVVCNPDGACSSKDFVMETVYNKDNLAGSLYVYMFNRNYHYFGILKRVGVEFWAYYPGHIYEF